MGEHSQSGMSKFWDVFGHYKRLLLAAGTASFLPFVAEFADASPPIPGVTPITSLLLILTAVITFQFFENSTRRKANNRIAFLLIVATISLISYFVASARFVFHYDSGQVILGCGWTSKAQTLATDYNLSTEAQCPGQYQDLLSDFGGKFSDVFVSQNLFYIEMMLIGTWIIFFLSVAGIIALFVTFQQGRKIKG